MLALIINELYLIIKHIKKNAEEKTLMIRSVLHSKLKNIINCKIIIFVYNSSSLKVKKIIVYSKI